MSSHGETDLVDSLIGRPAGSISRVVDNPTDPILEAIVEAAHTIAYDEDRFMSAWTLTSVLEDGSTWWADPEGGKSCHVSVTGEVGFY